MTLAFMFPGQSSRYPGMLDKLVDLHAPNADLLARASEALRWDLRAHFAKDASEPFARNLHVQIGVFLANHMFLQALHARGIEADLSLGLSLGEWNHLVHIGAVDFDDALLAVKARGEAYDSGPRGWMASVQPIDGDTLGEVVAKHRALGLLEVVNLNSPAQHVIAGDRAAVEAAVAELEEDHFATAVIIERQVPMHASVFESVGRQFRPILERVQWQRPDRPWLPNRLGHFMPNPKAADFVELMSTHVHKPVLWRKSVEYVASCFPGVTFVEVGPMAVLHNLMSRKWLKNTRFAVDSKEDTAAHFDRVVGELHAILSAANAVDVAEPMPAARVA